MQLLPPLHWSGQTGCGSGERRQQQPQAALSRGHAGPAELHLALARLYKVPAPLWRCLTHQLNTGSARESHAGAAYG